MASPPSPALFVRRWGAPWTTLQQPQERDRCCRGSRTSPCRGASTRRCSGSWLLRRPCVARARASVPSGGDSPIGARTFSHSGGPTQPGRSIGALLPTADKIRGGFQQFNFIPAWLHSRLPGSTRDLLVTTLEASGSSRSVAEGIPRRSRGDVDLRHADIPITRRRRRCQRDRRAGRGGYEWANYFQGKAQGCHRYGVGGTVVVQGLRISMTPAPMTASRTMEGSASDWRRALPCALKTVARCIAGDMRSLATCG